MRFAKFKGPVFWAYAFIVGSLLLAVGAAYADDPQCYEYSVNLSGHTYTGSSAGAACSAAGSGFAAAGTTGGPGGNTRSGSGSANEPGTVCTVDFTDVQSCISEGYPGGCGTSYPGSATAGIGKTPVDCPLDECAGKADTEESDMISVAGDGTPGQGIGDVCYKGCKMTVGQSLIITPGGAHTAALSTATYNGSQCGDTDAGAVKGQCNSNGSVLACAEKGKHNCGTFNGDEVCVDTIPPGSCASYDSGGLACTSDSSGATTPPDPDNGTPGTPATPDGTAVDSATGNTTNYYSSSTVTTSTVTTPSDPAPHTGNGGSSTGTTQVKPSAENGDCGAEGVDCSGAGDGTTPSLERSDSVASVVGSFESSIASIPVVAAVSGLSTAVPSGSCPNATFELWGTSFNFMEMGCDIWENYIAPIMNLVSLATWALLGVLIVMSA